VEPLTSRQSEVLDVIHRLYRERHRPVSLDEIAVVANLYDRSAALKYVRALEEKGHVRQLEGHRGVLPADTSAVSSIPIVGVCAAGVPLPTFSDLGQFNFNSEFGEPGLVMMRIDGESMIEAQIADGDFVLVRRDPEPPSGAKVVFSIDGGLTLKVLRRAKGEVWLYPCNRDMKAMRLKPDENAYIVGVLVGVVRKV